MTPAPPARRSCACEGLTLLELLAVVVVLAMVWAFVFPASDTVTRAGVRRLAAAESRSLAHAALLYRDTYGRWPLQDATVRLDADIAYGTNLTTTATVLSAAGLLGALTPRIGPHPDNPRQRGFIEVDAHRVQRDGFADPWSTPNRPSLYVVVVDANEDGWIGTTRDGVVAPLTVADATVPGRRHDIAPQRERVYVFSWSDGDTNRVSTARRP